MNHKVFHISLYKVISLAVEISELHVVGSCWQVGGGAGHCTAPSGEITRAG